MNDNDKRNLCTGCGLMPQKPVSPKPPVCGCKKKKCCKKDCCENDFVFRKVAIPAALGDDTTGKAKPENGAYTNSYVEYEANGAQYMYDSYGVYAKIEGGGGSEGTLDFNELENRPKYAGEKMTSNTDIPDVAAAVAGEATLRENADSGLQSQIDALSTASDVTDIVGTYAALQAYDTSKLKNNDIIKVLQDETHDDETTYYRWSTSTEEFSLIGEEGPYYTKAAADSKFQDKLTAGSNITIDANNEISATDTTYSNFTGTDGVDAGTSGLVPAPAVSDAGKYLKSDGTWDSVQAGPTVVQTTGTSTTDVMSQIATSNMIYPSGSETSKNDIFIKGVGEAGNGYVCIGQNSTNGKVNTTYGSLALGMYAEATGARAIAISGGCGIAFSTGTDSIAIGRSANARGSNSIAIGNSAGNFSPATNAVAIGNGAYTVADSVAIGYSPSTNNNQYGIAIGYNPRAWSENSIAIGRNIRINSLPGTVVIGNSGTVNTDYATRANEFCVHASTTANQPMVHSNVDTPTLGTDAANKDYVDSIYPVGAVFTSTSATAPTIAGGTWTEIGTQTIGSSTVHYYERTA